MRGLIAAVVAVLVAGGGGFGIGVALEQRGHLDPVAEPDPASVRDSRALAFDCPDGGYVVAFGRADRVTVTGRDDGGTWVQVRSPLDAGAFVWVATAQIEVDGGVDDLPVRSCGARPTPPTIPANPADDRPLVSSTLPAQDPTTTTAPATTSTTAPGGSSTTSSSASTSTSSSTSTTTGVTLFPPPSSTTTSSTSTTEPTDAATG